MREAARTAARLASGRLDERLTVRGEDEIAQLGSSFNSMADALQSQIRLLEDLSRVQRRFVSDVSHELRTPLTTVRMAADVLFDAREDFPGGASRSAELLQAELDRFEALLADLLEISRYDAGAADLDVSATDLCPLVRRVLAAAAPLAARHGSRFDLHLPARPVVADVEQVRIERVLRNLVVNAVEHGEGRPVEVALAGRRRQGRRHGAGPRRRAAARTGRHGLHPLLARRPVARPHDRRHRARARHRARGRAAARRLAAGRGRARPRLGVPHDAAAHRRHARCPTPRWSRRDDRRTPARPARGRWPRCCWSC